MGKEDAVEGPARWRTNGEGTGIDPSLVDGEVVKVGLVLSGMLTKVHGAQLEEAYALILGGRAGAAHTGRAPVCGNCA